MVEDRKLLVLKILALSLLIAATVLSLNDVMASKWGGHVGIFNSETAHSDRRTNIGGRGLRAEEPVPRIIHQAILGEHPPEYMDVFALTMQKRAYPMDFLVMDWRDEDADRLVSEEDAKGEIPGLLQAWEYIKSDTTLGRYAKMADFLRVLIMYSIGGIYFDADAIFCGDLEFLVDKPGFVSFPYQTGSTKEVNGNFMSAPPGHPLMKFALEYFVSEGEEIRTRGNMYAAGPFVFGKITDKYFFSRGVYIPPLEEKSYYDNDVVPGYIRLPRHDYYALEIVNVRFGKLPREVELYHLEFRSWIPGHETASTCAKHPQLISKYINVFCAKPKSDRHQDDFNKECGYHYVNGI